MGGLCLQPVHSNASTSRNSLQTEINPIEDVLIPIQSALRTYLVVKKVEMQTEIFSEPEERDPAQAVKEVSISAVPQLSYAAAATLSKLLPFSYDFTLPAAELRSPVLLNDGSVYIGQWHGAHRLGRGECHTREGGLLEGYWCNGLHYKGRIVYPNGDYFAGEFNRMVREGQGTLVEAQESYVGNWRSDLKWGFGEEMKSDGSVYTGQFEQGLKSGSGVLRWANGEFYDGEFLLGKRHGHGTYTWTSTKYYEGYWNFDRMEGPGTLVDGDTLYTGDFRHDQKHGKGLLRWAGNEYEGEFQEGKMHGLGWLTVPGKPRRLFRFSLNQRGQELPP